ncbi:MAG: DUF4136 domain-containing protein [Halopseudomonas sabulinigri]|jgi:hypothetical protein|tara:strand:- start:860 stop:1420 length:561 start_codon:yes stop_codon:yes gene_type:complete
MRRLFLLLPAVLLIAACQGAAVQPDYDVSRNFGDYRTWQFDDPAVSSRPENDPRLTGELTSERVKDSVSNQMELRGLRPPAAGQSADLKVKAYLMIENRQDNVSTSFGGYWGTGWGGFWGGPSIQTQSVDYKELILQIDMLDSSDGKLVWRGSESESMSERPQTPAKREEQINRLVGKILGSFPPN